MGRRKKYTAAGLERAVEAYFAGISYERPRMKAVPELDENGYPIMDAFGHQKIRFEQVVTADGQTYLETVWAEPPSLSGLCMYLGIDRATFARYGTFDPENPKESERFCNTVSRARGRVEAYLESRLEDSHAARGVMFNLEHNFGWRQKGQDDGAAAQAHRGEAAQNAGLEGMTMGEKLRKLKEAGVDVSQWE